MDTRMDIPHRRLDFTFPYDHQVRKNLFPSLRRFFIRKITRAQTFKQALKVDGEAKRLDILVTMRVDTAIQAPCASIQRP